jgi:hypothetical protein
MSDPQETHALLGGLRASVTVADEFFRIIFMNDLAIEHYAYGGGQALVGTNLLDCHNAESQSMLRQMYARYLAGDLTPTRYRVDKGDDLGKSIVFFPLIVRDQFRGVAELIWYERSDLVFEE